MLNYKKIAPAIALAALVSAGGFATHIALADAVKPADHAISASAPAAMPSKAIPQMSQLQYETMRAARGARIAIFNGHTGLAAKLVGVAMTDLKAAEKHAAVIGPDGVFTVKSPADIGSNKPADDRFIPLDGQILLADNYVVTPEKSAAIKNANEHLAKGEHQKAAEVLKLASVDVAYSRVMMPLAATQAHLQTAADLVAKKQYYEANLALKAAQDGLKVDTISLVDTMPKSG